MKQTSRRISEHLFSLIKGVRRNSSKIFLGIAAAWLVSALAVVVYAQCAPSIATSWATFKTRDQQGLLHVTVSYNGGEEGAPDATVLRLMQEAVAEWNSYKCTTGVQFDPAGIGSATLEFVYTTSEADAGGCAVYDASTTRIFHGENFKLRVQQLGDAQARAVFKHELGHFLGLDHTTSPATIMNQGANCLSPITVTFVQPSDAQKVASCMGATNVCPTPTPTPTPTPPIVFTCPNPVNFALYPSGGCPVGSVNNGAGCCVCNRSSSFMQQCNRFGGYDEETCNCSGCDTCAGSPILVDLYGDGFHMSSAEDGVVFDLNGNGTPDRFSWTAAGSDDSWLALDRNGNGRVDSGKELFGNYTAQPEVEEPNGFLALAEFDKVANGGNGDGVIDSADNVYRFLLLWRDANHDGVSQPEELSPLAAMAVTGLELRYRESKRADEFGNEFRYRAKVFDERGVRLGRWAWDVFLVPRP